MHLNTFLTEHQPGCTPVRPCDSCEAVTFLRSKLSAENFDALFELLASDAGSPTQLKPGPYSASNPMPDDVSISYLPLSVLTLHALQYAEIDTVGKLVTRSPEQLLGLRSLGPRGLLYVTEALKEVGRSLT